jgi:hypothetical protein
MRRLQTRLQFTPEALQERDAALQYYRNIGLPLGVNFNRVINRSLRLIRADPSGWLLVEGNLHVYTCDKFPFRIFYRYSAEAILIISIFNTSQDPDRLIGR